jgi:hypothetical protein
MIPTPADSHAGNRSICADLAKRLAAERLRTSKPPSTYIDSTQLQDGRTSYLGVDLDVDSKDDFLAQSCGSDGTCILEVGLSGGGSFNVELNRFYVIRYTGKYFVLVGDTYPKRKDIRRDLHSLSGDGTQQICFNF